MTAERITLWKVRRMWNETGEDYEWELVSFPAERTAKQVRTVPSKPGGYHSILKPHEVHETPEAAIAHERMVWNASIATAEHTIGRAMYALAQLETLAPGRLIEMDL